MLYFICSSGSHFPSEDKDEDEDDKRRKMDTSGHGGNSKRKLNTHQISTIQFCIPKVGMERLGRVGSVVLFFIPFQNGGGAVGYPLGEIVDKNFYRG